MFDVDKCIYLLKVFLKIKGTSMSIINKIEICVAPGWELSA